MLYEELCINHIHIKACVQYTRGRCIERVNKYYHTY